MGSDLNIEITSALAAESGNNFPKRIRGDDPGRNSLLLKGCRRQAEQVFIARYEKTGFCLFAKGKIMVVFGVSGEGDFSRNGNAAGESHEVVKFFLDDGDSFVGNFFRASRKLFRALEQWFWKHIPHDPERRRAPLPGVSRQRPPK